MTQHVIFIIFSQASVFVPENKQESNIVQGMFYLWLPAVFHTVATSLPFQL
jgi:hypothetical protein